MNETILDLAFKGERDYLQGPDICDAALAAIVDQADGAAVGDFDISFHRLARRQLRLVFGAAPAADEAAAVGVCKFRLDGRPLPAGIVETGAPVADRVPYPEDEIVARMAFVADADEVTLDQRGGYSDAELFVSMTKALHRRALPHITGKWLFVRGRFPRYERNRPGRTLGLALAANFNDKLTRSEARIDGVKVGEIFFSVV